ncbi:MAG: radical SAM protein [Melioribacteraceae bacterium]|nr:radical SAM protein [Melioribacteraceae bacterium]
MFVNDICVGLLSQCNWNCGYCIASNNSSEIDEDSIFSELFPIRHKLKNRWISGGEPGLLSESFWSRVLMSIDFNLMICTNGTFITKGLYDKFRDRISKLMIHCVSELDKDIHPDVLKVVNEERDKVFINIVVHKYNVDQIRDFLTRYNDISFDLNFADQTFAEQSISNYDYIIDRKAALTILKQLGSLPKYTLEINRVTRALLDNDYQHLNSWSIKNVNPG